MALVHSQFTCKPKKKPSNSIVCAFTCYSVPHLPSHFSAVLCNNVMMAKPNTEAQIIFSVWDQNPVEQVKMCRTAPWWHCYSYCTSPCLESGVCGEDLAAQSRHFIRQALGRRMIHSSFSVKSFVLDCPNTPSSLMFISYPLARASLIGLLNL
jgi:hypothetical protein